jgi:hypothetical protein
MYPLFYDKDWLLMAFKTYGDSPSLFENTGIDMSYIVFRGYKMGIPIKKIYKKRITKIHQLFMKFKEKYCICSEDLFFDTKYLIEAFKNYCFKKDYLKKVNQSRLSSLFLRNFNIKTSNNSKLYLGIKLNQIGFLRFLPTSIEAKTLNTEKNILTSRNLCKICDCQPTINKFNFYYESTPLTLRSYIDREIIIKLIKQIEINLFKLNKKRKPETKIGLALQIHTPLCQEIIHKIVLREKTSIVSIRSLKDLFMNYPKFKEYVKKNEIQTTIVLKDVISLI